MKFLRDPIPAAIGLAVVLFCLAGPAAGATASGPWVSGAGQLESINLVLPESHEGRTGTRAAPGGDQRVQFDRGRKSRNNRMRRRSRERDRESDGRDGRQYRQDRNLPRQRNGDGDGRRSRTPIQNRRGDHDKARDAVRQGQALPLGVIVRNLRSYCPGTFLNATLQQGRGGLVYHVRLLSRSGRRQTFVFDATSGAMIAGRCR